MTKKEMWEKFKRDMNNKCRCCGNHKYQFIYLVYYRPFAKIGEEIKEGTFICKDCFLGDNND